MANQDAGKLEESISTFTFRNRGSIVIPKSKREKAYTMAVDVMVRSIDFSRYGSDKTIPTESFYGYGTLVFQDCLSDKIPLRFGLNRIYYSRNSEAFSQWEFHRQYYSIENQLLFMGTKLGINPDDWLSGFPPIPKFVELPLREVYIEVQDNCQFEIEYTQWQPISYTSDRGVSQDGKSNQDDGDKDSGLPANGTQPRQNNPANPFGGNVPASSISDLGAFYNPKLSLNGSSSNLNNPNVGGLDNQQLTFRFSFLFSYLNGSGNVQAFPCTEFVTVTGLYSDNITVMYNEQIGTGNDGTKGYRVSLIWKGAVVLGTFGAGIVNASVQQCGRNVI